MRLRVAALLGRTLHELGQSMPSGELPLWEAFWQYEPWGFQGMDYHRAQLSATLANVIDKPKTAYQASQFQTCYPDAYSSGGAPEQTPEQTESYLERVLR